jgi:hypothetical protein
VKVAHEFQEVALLLYDDRLVPILEEMPHASVASIERASVAGEEAPHAARERALHCTDQEMRVIWEKGPRVEGPGASLYQARHPADEVRSIHVVPKDDATLPAAHHYVVENSWRVETGLAWHGGRVA